MSTLYPEISIKWFNSDKGVDFIANAHGSDGVFVRFSSVVSDGYKSLNEGDKVTSNLEQDPKNSCKLRAVNVRVEQ